MSKRIIKFESVQGVLSCIVALATFGVASAGSVGQGVAQDSVPNNLQIGMSVPPDVEQITTKALQYLVDSQNQHGTWEGGYDSHAQGLENCGVVGLATMAMLSTGEDPNAGPYAANIHASLRYLILTQNPETGFLPTTMYNHGFAMLALSEAYGTVDDELIWASAPGVDPKRKRTLGEALRLAVQLAVNSQDINPAKAWRYRPTSQDTDTSVTGAVLIGLLAARNAGIAVPDESISNGIGFLEDMTSRRSGSTRYDRTRESLSHGPNLSAITALVMSISHSRDSDKFVPAADRIKKFIDLKDESFPYYNMYYMAQALFQTDYDSWNRWNQITIRRLRRQQQADGSFKSQHGQAYGTAMACLSLALNYRFLPIYER